ncbi:MAG TPA: DUF116 domain-containing protein [Candidatus Altiarchaeales archaeon]|nr:DUF116 domain-containing protein [Candidatus Altiarchaeales archaeon]
MAVFGIGLYHVLGALGVLTLLGFGVLTASILLSLIPIIIFIKTGGVVVPKVTLLLVGLVESPLKHLLWFFGIEEGFLPNMVVEIRNRTYKPAYCATEYKDRMIFLPQCLRHPECPAPLTPDGLKCVSCGRCGIYRIRDFANTLGCGFFIAPGSTLIYRMVKKYRPKAIAGVGCLMEIKEGSEAVASMGLPVQAVMLERDGCVDTRIDVSRLLEVIKARDTKYRISDDKQLLDTAKEIEGLWLPKNANDLGVKVLKTGGFR